MAARNIESICRLTALQEGVLFHTLEAARDGVYVNQYSCDFKQAVNLTRLQEAWGKVAERHGALRCLFTWERREKPLQIVRSKVELPWQTGDWREFSDNEQAQRWASLLAIDRDAGFDLERPPLMRLHLIQLRDSHFRFLLTFHHILLDGWSLRLLMSEALQIYADGPDVCASMPKPRPFPGFVEWLDRQNTDHAEKHWQELLRGFQAASRLPFDAAGGEPQAALQRELSISAESTEQISTMARAERLTLNSVVLGVWAMLLARHAAVDDVVFGTTLSGRPPTFEGADRVAGLFINTLPLRVRLDQDIDCASWLRAIQAQQVAMQGLEQTPLVSVQKWSELPPGESLFDSIVVFENFPKDSARIEAGAGLQVSEEHYLEFSNYPLALLAVPGDNLRLIAIFDPGRFDESDIDELLLQCVTVLSAMASQPHAPLDDISLLSTAAQRRLLDEWNDTRVEFPPHNAIHELFEQCALETPATLAVTFDNQSLDYQTLDRRANQLANLLLERGAKRQACIPVFMDRSADAVVAILAVLKSGAAYVPIDASFPDKRLDFVLDDLAPADREESRHGPVVIAHSSLKHRLADKDVDVLCIDEATTFSDFSPTKPAITFSPDDLAYVIYTSGSTGRPKGVMVTHGNLLNSTLARTHHYPETLSAYLVLSSFATDSSVAGLFWTLCTGGLLVLPRGRQEQDVDRLCSLIAEHRVSHLLAVPSLYGLILENADRALLDSVKAVLVAGEACTTSVVRQHQDVLPNTALYNEYGPTEGTVWTTVARLDQQRGVVTIGRPIANTQVYILDNAMRPVATGVAGELCIGGSGVASGYLNSPQETARRFTENPFSRESSSRLYRTGDRARFRVDGAIELVGRVDNQIKIRGYRVEPEEIESVLASHPNVSEAAVWLDHSVSHSVPDKQRGARLAACVIAKASRDVDSDALREHVRQQLTDYMVPQVIVAIDALPRTVSGKLDRDALSAIELASPPETAHHDFTAPANDVESTLARIWADVLGLDEVSTHDNFFEAGGDSLLSIRILSQANRAGLRINPEKFFAHPTIAEQAKLAEPEGAVAAEQGFVTGHAPLIPIQCWFFENVTTRPQQWNQAPLYALSPPVERLILERALQRLLNHHDALRSRIVSIEGNLVQNYSQSLAELPIDWIELQSRDDDTQKTEITAFANAAHAEFALDKGPLVRFAYFSTPGSSHDYLLIIAHHLIIDAVSWRVLIEDLNTLLDSLERGKSVALPRKTTASKEWAARLAELANTKAITEQAAFWTGLRADFQVPLSLPGTLDENTVGTTFTVTTELDSTSTGILVDTVPKIFRTRINDVLLAALTMAFRKFADADTIRFDLEGHGREPLFDDVDLSRTIGWFTTTYPVILHTSRDDPAGLLLRSVKDQLRAIPSNGIGHGVLRYLKNDPELARLPKSQLLFNYLGRIDDLTDYADRLRLLESNVGEARAVDGRRIYVIEIDSRIQDGRLILDWKASDRLHSRAAIEGLAESYLESLQRILAATSSGEMANSPTDFPLADLDAGDIENLAGLLESIDDDS